MKNIRGIACALAIGLVLIAQLLSSSTVYADGETTPEPMDTSEVTTTPDPTEDTVIPEITSTPVPVEPTIDPVTTETPLPPAESPEVPTETSEPAELTPETVEPVATEEAVEGPVVAEILAGFPEGTDLVVLNENGEPAPLATQDAVEIITTGDPVWCPDGVPPTRGANGCSASYATLGELVLAIGATTNQNGTIWITSGLAGDSSVVVIDGSVYTTWANYSLTLQGGWDGANGSSSIVGNSTFTIPIEINWWRNDLSVNNLSFQNGSGNSLALGTNKNITVKNGTFQGPLAFTFSDPQGTVKLTVINSSSESWYFAGIGFTCTYENYGTGGAYLIDGGGIINLEIEISCGHEPPPPPPPSLVTRAQGEEFELSCIGQTGFAVNLPNGDLVNIFCPVSGRAKINRVDNTTLPSELPTGYTYASAFALDIAQNDQSISVITEGGYIKASFVAQPLQPGNTYSVLYWDKENATWVSLKDLLVDGTGAPRSFELFPGASDDTRKIISGVRINPTKGRVEVSTNFPGIFVLAQH